MGEHGAPVTGAERPINLAYASALTSYKLKATFPPDPPLLSILTTRLPTAVYMIFVAISSPPSQPLARAVEPRVSLMACTLTVPSGERSRSSKR